MRILKNQLMKLMIFSGFYILLCIHYYFIYPLYLGTWDDFVEMISFQHSWSYLVWFDILLTIIGSISVTYGFYKRKYWARFYMIGYLSYSSFWAFFSMFVIKWQIFEHYIYLIFYVFFLMYLLQSDVKEYFKRDEKTQIKPTEIKLNIEKKTQDKNDESITKYSQINDYILHKKMVKARNGELKPFYFFSKGFSKKGTPCKKPDGYILKHNKKTGVPYLKKK